MHMPTGSSQPADMYATSIFGGLTLSLVSVEELLDSTQNGGLGTYQLFAPLQKRVVRPEASRGHLRAPFGTTP